MRINLLGALAAIAVIGALGFSAHSLFASNTVPTTQPATSNSQIEVPPPPPTLAPIQPAPTTSPSLVPTPPPTEQVQAPPAPTTASSSTTMPSKSQRLAKVVVTSDLDLSRDEISPPLGATTYTIGPDQINVIPEGENTPFYQVLLRAPGVVTDSFGQEHVRGEHANTTYDVNGVLLPQPINTFGQELDTHMVQSVTLIDGSLPAQYGFHTAAIIDVTSKSGPALQGGEVSLYGGQFNTFEPSVATRLDQRANGISSPPAR
jgi:hypothetical protein